MQTTSRVIRRGIHLAGILLLLGLGKSFAQTAPAVTSTDPADDSVVKLSRFTVRDTAGKGYVSNDSASGLKSNTLLIDVPQSIQIIPRDVIEDLGFTNSTLDIVKYGASGVVPFAYGDFTIMRGYNSGSGAVMIDGQLDLMTSPDPATIDSIEVVKGPAQMLFGPRIGLAGLINKHTKQPLPYRRDSIRVAFGEGGLRRGEIDATGPLGSIGDTKVSYRVIVADQKFDGFRPSDFDNRKVFNGSLRFDFNKDTSLLVQYDHTDSKIHGLGNYFQDQYNTFKTYTGPGSEKSYSAKWGYSHLIRDWEKITFKHAFNDQWDVTAGLAAEDYIHHDNEVRNNGNPDWVHNLLPQYNLNWKFHAGSYSLSVDVNGKYEVFGLRASTVFGIDPEHTTNHDHEYDFDLPSVSITNPTTYDSARPDQLAQIAALPNGGSEYRSRTNTDFYAAYFMQSLEVWRDRLTLVAGISAARRSNVSTDELTNTAAEVTTEGKPHRLGAIYKPFANNNLSFYFNNSTAFTGGGGRNIHGGTLPPEIGEVTEGGFKTSWFNGRISSTVTYYKLNVTNIPIFDFTIHPGGNYPGGTQYNHGTEVDLAFQITDSWSIVASNFTGHIHDQTGKRLPNTINDSSSLITRYEFHTGPLKGFHAGVSAFHEGNRINPNFESYTTENLFFGYRYKAFTVTVNIDNLENKVYSPGGWAPFYHDLAPPRNAHATVAYKF